MIKANEICKHRAPGLSSNSVLFRFSLDDLPIEMAPDKIIEGGFVITINTLEEKEIKIVNIKKTGPL